jgi:hypothetical protein
MGSWKAALIGGDPVAREGELSAADAEAMRRAIVSATDSRAPAAFWPRPMFLAATVAVTMIVGLVLGAGLPRMETRITKRPTSTRLAAFETSTPATHFAERRQLQFATPGGTRIIWVFDPAFNP